MRNVTGSQCKLASIGVICSYLLVPDKIWAAAFCTSWSRALTDAGVEYIAVVEANSCLMLCTSMADRSDPILEIFLL